MRAWTSSDVLAVENEIVDRIVRRGGNATTAYGAQGSTVPVSHVLIGHQSGAASAYVGMTRGRDHNIAHLVAESLEDARGQ